MDSLIRAVVVYLFLLLVFRVAGRRTLGETTTFDFVLLLIISEAAQQAMIDDDNSVTNALLLVTTLVGLNIMMGLAKRRWKAVAHALDGVPVVVVRDGKPIADRMKAERLDDDDILSAARETQGLARMDQVAYAVVEESGRISVVPRDQAAPEHASPHHGGSK
jgi:uncharacterized membrane protein YcaP (DUF421 family)